jgi:hydrogenase maturation protease
MEQQINPDNKKTTTKKSLVIGIGNILRGDDGVGALLADQVCGCSVQQLTPELAEELAVLDKVLFIDAWVAPVGAAPVLARIVPIAGSTGSHRLEPAQLLAISQALYGHTPEAFLLRVPATTFVHGTTLSPDLKATLPAARELLQGWLARHA